MSFQRIIDLTCDILVVVLMTAIIAVLFQYAVDTDMSPTPESTGWFLLWSE